MDNISASYRICETISKRNARNFYYAFSLLPKDKKRAICAVYSYLRACDDISDSEIPPHLKLEYLEKLRRLLHERKYAIESKSIMAAFFDAVDRFNIPTYLFHELIDGTEMDILISRYETFDELQEYCFKVAGVVGLICLYIFGYKHDSAFFCAEKCGIAFQLTNILRDIGEDTGRERIYIPTEDLEKYNYSEIDVYNHIYDDRFCELMRFEVDRTRNFYKIGSPLIGMINSSSKSALAAMIGIYSSVLNKIEALNYNVYNTRASLGTSEKLAVAAKAIIGSRHIQEALETTGCPR